MTKTIILLFVTIGFCLGQESKNWQHEIETGYTGFYRYKHGFDIQYSLGRIISDKNVFGLKPGFLFLNNFSDFKYVTVKVFYERYFSNSERLSCSFGMGLETWRNEISNMAWKIGIFNTNKTLALEQKYYCDLSVKYSVAKNLLLSGGAFIIFGHAENNDSKLYRDELAYRISPRISICYKMLHH